MPAVGGVRHHTALPEIPRLPGYVCAELTDVDDKIIARSQEEGVNAAELAENTSGNFSGMRMHWELCELIHIHG